MSVQKESAKVEAEQGHRFSCPMDALLRLLRTSQPLTEARRHFRGSLIEFLKATRSLLDIPISCMERRQERNEDELKKINVEQG